MIDDDGKLKQKFYNKQSNAKKEGIGFELSYEQFVQKLIDANISSSQCGIRGYHLARINDSGPYTVESCRFIYCLENYSERKISDKMREASRITAKTKMSKPESREKANASNRARRKFTESS